MEVASYVTGLTPKDLAFLQRSRKSVRAGVVCGWLFIGLSVFSGIIAAVNFDRLWAISQVKAIEMEAARKFEAENNRLKALQTTTALEEKLVNALIEKNKWIEVFLRMQVVSAVLIILGILIGGLLSQGVALIINAYGTQRHLGIIETLERTLRLSRG